LQKQEDVLARRLPNRRLLDTNIQNTVFHATGVGLAGTKHSLDGMAVAEDLRAVDV